MILGYDYPVLGFFWSMLVFFLWVAWIFLLFRIFADIFRNDQMGGFAKALWLIFVVILPFIGVLGLLTVQGDSMARRLRSQQAQREAFDGYVQERRGTPSSHDGSPGELLEQAGGPR